MTVRPSRPFPVLFFDRKKAKTRPYTAEDLEDPFVKCDIFNAKPPIWEEFVEEPPGTFTRNGKIQKIAFGMQGAMTFKLRHIIEVKGGQLKFIKVMKI